MSARAPKKLAAASVAAALFASAGAALASPEDVFGFGPTSVAMGATGTAIGEGFGAVYNNPALLSLARRRELSLGVFGATFDLHAKQRVSYEALRGSLIGAILPVPFGGVLKDRVAIGLGFFTPFRLVVRGRILYPETPQFLVADRTQSVAVQAGIGVHLGHGVRIGAGFASLAALTGSVLVATDASGRIGTVVEDTLVASYGPILGASYDLGDAWRIGLAWRGALVGHFNVVITVKDLGQITVPPLNISGIAQYDPWQLAGEVARTKGPWRAALGLVYKHWSAYPGAAEATVRCPDVDPSTGEKLSSCGALVPAPVDYHDTIAPHVGVERVVDAGPDVRMHLRAGYFLEPTPAPAQTKAANLYDETRSAFTLGYGVELGAADLDFFAQAQVLHPRTHTKESDVPASNPGAPSVTTSGLIVAAGTTLGVKF